MILKCHELWKYENLLVASGNSKVTFPKDVHLSLRGSENIAITYFELDFTYPLVIYFVNYF